MTCPVGSGARSSLSINQIELGLCWLCGLTNRTVRREDRWDIRKLLADLRRSFPAQNGESLLVMEVCSIDTRSLVPEDFITIHHYSVCADCRYKHLTLSSVKLGYKRINYTPKRVKEPRKHNITPLAGGKLKVVLYYIHFAL